MLWGHVPLSGVCIERQNWSKWLVEPEPKVDKTPQFCFMTILFSNISLVSYSLTLIPTSKSSKKQIIREGTDNLTKHWMDRLHGAFEIRPWATYNTKSNGKTSNLERIVCIDLFRNLTVDGVQESCKWQWWILGVDPHEPSALHWEYAGFQHQERAAWSQSSYWNCRKVDTEVGRKQKKLE